MLMGIEAENIQDLILPLKTKKSTKSKLESKLENRMFVCVGFNKFTKTREFWLMIYSKDFKNVNFYDVKNNLTITLRGRVKEESEKVLQAYLNFDKDKMNQGSNGDDKKTFMEYIKARITFLFF